MLDYLLLTNKSEITLKDKEGNNVVAKDLLQKVAIPSDIPYEDVVVVNKYYVARPDLISLAFYGTDRYADYLCKYNGLSNPFELNENMLFFIPPLDRINDQFIANQPASELINDDGSNLFVSKEYPLQKEKNEKRSPAESVVGEQNYVIDKSLGLVFY